MKVDLVKLGNGLFGEIVLTKRRMLMKTDPERFLSIRQVCDLLGVAHPTGVHTIPVDLDRPLTLVTAWLVGVVKGSMFVHLPEESLSLCDQAMERGATVILSDEELTHYPCILVQDAGQAYSSLCALLKRQKRETTVAVTGSIGKTTTKEMLASVTRKHFPHTFASPDNSNMQYMIGQFTQMMPKNCDLYIQECHEGDPRSVELISTMIEPDVAIVTNIGLSHASRFRDVDGLIYDVSKISTGMSEGGVVIINADCENISQVDFAQTVVKIGINSPAVDFRAESITPDEKGTTFLVRSEDSAWRVRLNIMGEHNVINALLVWAAAVVLGVPEVEIAAGLEKYRPSGVRQNTARSGRNKLVYLDCFNAAPASMRSAISNLCSHSTPRQGGRRIAVLGNMEELGDSSGDQHAAVGRLVAASPVDTLIAYGDKAVDMAEAASGDLRVLHTVDFDELVRMVKAEVQPGDAALLKASHSMDFDRLVLRAFPDVYLRHVVPEQMRSGVRRLSLALRQ